MKSDTVKQNQKILIDSSKRGLVKGFRDITGEDALKQSQIKKVMVAVFERYGFEPAETPVVEYEEFVKGDNASDEAVSDVFKLEDRGNRKLALRYEFTFQLKRLAKNKKLPYKRYQIGPVFRDEPISENRFRQFTQCDVDVIGSSVKDDAEILALIRDVFGELGIKIEISVGNRALLNEILDLGKVRGDKNQILREIDKLDKLSEKEVKDNLRKLGAEKLVGILKKPESYFKKFESYKDVETLKKVCDFYGVKFVFKPSLVRGLSYYNKNVFEVSVKNIGGSVGGGGTYMVNGLQATGIAFGLDRIASIVKLKDGGNPVLIISIDKDKEAVKLASDLRGKGISCSVYYGKPGKALEYANSKGLKYVVFVGDKEIKSGKFTLKDLGSGEESGVSGEGVVKKIAR